MRTRIVSGWFIYCDNIRTRAACKLTAQPIPDAQKRTVHLISMRVLSRILKARKAGVLIVYRCGLAAV